MIRKLRLLSFILLVAVSSGFAQVPVANPISATPISGCPPLLVSFNGSATGPGVITYNWNFGGIPPNVSKATSNKQNDIVIFNTPGTYTVTLIASNANGNSAPVTQIITVNPVPVADFNQDKTTGCYPTTINFTNASTPLASIVSYTWDYGDGSQDYNIQNPSHVYRSAGNFGVTLYVTNTFGCTGSRQVKNIQKAITITGGIIPNFSDVLNSSCQLPVTATFTNSTTGPNVMSYTWDYGDGSPLVTNPANPNTHNFLAAGNYNVKLAATSTQGCTDTLIQPVSISASGSVSDFTGAGNVCINTPVSFTNTSSPNPNSSTWDYGDGSPIDPVRNGLHTYTTLGPHTVILTNTFSGCSGTVSKTVTVVGPPTTNFSATNVNACQPPLTTNFTDLSIGATSWSWDFGDGSPLSTLKSPSHTYTTFGSYTVTLTTGSAGGCSNTFGQSAFVKIIAPVVSLTNAPAYGCAPFIYSPVISVTTADGVASYNWDFGNGFTFNGPIPPAQVYAAGTYTVKVTIVTNGGCSSTATGTVQVGNTKPVPAFTFIPPAACIKSSIVFTDQSTGGPNQWLWDFGDGTTSTGPTATHAYTQPGSFKVQLTAYNNGCWDTISHVVTINPPKAAFTFASACGARNKVTFTDNSMGATGWTWDFGDGSPLNNTQNPMHVYAAGAQTAYTVKLTVINSVFGCSDNISQSVLVNQTAIIAVSPMNPCKNTSVTASLVSSPNVSFYTYDFGDGSPQVITGGTSAQHTYTNPGTYNITMFTTDISGCNDFANTIVEKVGGPTVNFTQPPLVSCGPLTYTFINTSTPNGYALNTFAWDFGDGTTSAVMNPPAHTYAFQGNFLVKLKVTDANGCADSLISSNLITVSIPKANFTVSEDSSCPSAPTPIRFSNTSTGGYNSVFTWDFGDGSPTSNVFSPAYSYTAVGSYNVKLSILDNYGCTASYTYPKSIFVDVPVASFNMSGNYSACPPFNDQFTFTGKYAVKYSWDFNVPGGAFSQIKNPIYLYANPGDYDPYLIVTSHGGCQATAPSQHVHIDGPIGLFSYTPFTGCNALDVNFQVTTSNVVNYTWNFGDGSPLVTTSVPTIPHHYGPGDWTPSVILEDALGCKVNKIGANDIIVDTIANISFTAVKSILCDTGTVVFSDISKLGTGTVISAYAWDFGDGNTQNGLFPVTSHYYSAVNNYTSSLTITTAGGCSATTTVPIIVAASPQIDISGLLSQCEPALLNFSGTEIVPDPSVPLTWKWDFANGQTGNGQFPTPPLISYPKAGDYPVQLVAINKYGCTDTAIQHLYIYPIPTVEAGIDTTICLGTTLLLNATGQATIYNWLPPVVGSLSCNACQSPVATVPSSTYFVVNGMSAQGCNANDTIQVTVNVPPVVNVSGPDSVCLGQSTQLVATGAAIYDWTPAQGLNNPNIANPVATPDASQIGGAPNAIITYQVTGYDSKKCFSDIDSVHITAFNYPTLSMPANATINVGSSYQITATGSADIVSLTWNPSNTLSCANCLSPLATPTKTTKYVLTSVNDGGCATNDSIRVQVICNGANFFVPNTFSPNGDGVNDHFIVNGVGLNVIPSITIFNRWGQIVFQKSNFAPNSAAEAWDGTFNGKPAPADVYIFTIQILCDNATLIPYHGNVTLIR